ncbi:MAG TPA: LuxR C-terminal-related transcriptional regulator [Polyangiaceae bacterium]
MPRHRSDKVSVVEAAYLPALSETEWLEQIVRSAAPFIAEGLGALALIYYGAKGRLRRGAHATVDLAFDPTKTFLEPLENFPPEMVDQTWRKLSFGLGSEVGSLGKLAQHVPAIKTMYDAGVRDVLNINAYDPSGVGVWLGAPLPVERKRRPKEGETWARVGAHLGSALRLRLRNARAKKPDDATAVLDTRGHIAHAKSGKEADRLSDQLRDAVLRMERARGSMRRSDPDGAVEIWRTLVDGELTLLDHFERGGKRYIVAVANAAHASSPGIGTLRPRERQVVVSAAAGRSNKMIAYELGLAHSTVRVLLARAAQRLGATSRRELVAMVRAHALP